MFFERIFSLEYDKPNGYFYIEVLVFTHIPSFVCVLCWSLCYSHWLSFLTPNFLSAGSNSLDSHCAYILSTNI